MAIEIERKFLIASDAWRSAVRRCQRMAQGYLLANVPETASENAASARCSVRVRVGDDGAFLNIKSRTLGVQRQEFEYPIPTADAETMLRDLAVGAAIVKTRHYVPVQDGLVFEIDEFAGDNAGLVVAELELSSVTQAFERPSWLGEEVTDDARYYNSNLVNLPFCRW